MERPNIGPLIRNVIVPNFVASALEFRGGAAAQTGSDGEIPGLNSWQTPTREYGPQIRSDRNIRADSPAELRTEFRGEGSEPQTQ